MLDLLIALILLIVPVGLAQLGLPQVLIAALSTGSILIWPGYILSRLLWKQRRPNIQQQLALVPLMSILLVLIISLSAWAALGQLDAQLVYVGTLIATIVIVLGQLVIGVARGDFKAEAPAIEIAALSVGTRGRSALAPATEVAAPSVGTRGRSAGRPPTGTGGQSSPQGDDQPAGSSGAVSTAGQNTASRSQPFHAFSGAFVMFAVLALLVGLAVGWPQATARAGQMAIYLDPQSAPAFNKTSKSLAVPLILSNPERAPATQIELRAEFMGAVVVQQVALAPGEQRQVMVTIPSMLAAHDVQPIDIQARSLDAANAHRQLRFWLKPE